MMIKNTMFHHLPSILRIQFDAELADKMCADIEKRFGEMLLDADYRDNKEIKWHMVTHYCVAGRIPGAVKKGNLWLVPVDAEKPKDGRYKDKGGKNEPDTIA